MSGRPSDGRPSDVELGRRDSPRGKRSDKRVQKPSKKSQVASEPSIQAPKEPWKISIRINEGKYCLKTYLLFIFIINHCFSIFGNY